MKNLSLAVHGALFAVALIYGANYSIAKTITPAFIGAFGIVVIRVYSAAAIFWLVTPRERIKHWQDYLHLAACGLFGIAINQLCFFKGLSITLPVNASVIMTTTPIMVLVATAIILREQISSSKLLGIALGFSGAVLLITGGGFSFNADTFRGDIFILINALSYGIYLVIVKPLMRRYRALTVIKWIFTFGCFYVLPFGLEELRTTDWTIIPRYGYVALAYIIVFTTFFAYLLNGWALKHASPNLVGYYIYLQPIIATTIAIIFRGDPLSLQTILFAGLIFMGVWLVSRESGLSNPESKELDESLE